MEWLKEVEAQIARAGKEIASLRKRNRSLTSQVKRLKREAQVAGEASAGKWDEEREELRRQAEKVATQLESLLD